MKIINLLPATSVVTLIFFACPSFSAEQKSNFESGELQSIRNISQSILKVRGKQRQNVLTETQPLREEIQLIKEELKQAGAIDQPSIVINKSSYSVSTDSLIPASSAERLSRWWRSVFNNKTETKKNTLPQILKSETIKTAHLNNARALVSKRKQKIDKNMPSFWQFNQSADQKQLQIHQALVNLENNIDQLSKVKGNARTEKIKAIIAKLNSKKAEIMVKQPNDLTPTLTSITQHYRK